MMKKTGTSVMMRVLFTVGCIAVGYQRAVVLDRT